jgi:DNA-binding CsgD family transcriptional regulator
MVGPSVSPEQLRNLSPREREVLRSFLDGCSVAVSARLLHVSEHTVRSHLKSVYRKLGVRSQTELLRSMRRIDGLQPADAGERRAAPVGSSAPSSAPSSERGDGSGPQRKE